MKMRTLRLVTGIVTVLLGIALFIIPEMDESYLRYYTVLFGNEFLLFLEYGISSLVIYYGATVLMTVCGILTLVSLKDNSRARMIVTSVFSAGNIYLIFALNKKCLTICLIYVIFLFVMSVFSVIRPGKKIAITQVSIKRKIKVEKIITIVCIVFSNLFYVGIIMILRESIVYGGIHNPETMKIAESFILASPVALIISSFTCGTLGKMFKQMGRWMLNVIRFPRVIFLTIMFFVIWIYAAIAAAVLVLILYFLLPGLFIWKAMKEKERKLKIEFAIV